MMLLIMTTKIEVADGALLASRSLDKATFKMMK